MIEAFDRAEGWSRQGFVSCAAFLSYRVELGKVAAREHVRVARALPELPVIAESLAAGELSFSKVRALTRVANPKNEVEPCSIAKAGTAAHVERLVRAKVRAYCSWCFSETSHLLRTRNFVRRNIGECAGCHHRTVQCRYCAAMARGGRWDDECCAVHDGTIANFRTLGVQLGNVTQWRRITECSGVNMLRAGKVSGV